MQEFRVTGWQESILWALVFCAISSGVNLFSKAANGRFYGQRLAATSHWAAVNPL